MDLAPERLRALLDGLSDDNRLLSLQLDGDDPALGSLLLQRLHGREALSTCYRFELDCLSSDAAIATKRLLGRRVSVAINGAAGGARLINGIVTRVAPRGADGALARYRLSVEPPFALLGLARSSWIYQALSVPAIIDAELRHWQHKIPALQWRLNLLGQYPVRSYTARYRESPLAFLTRLAAEEGIGFCFEHLAAAQGESIGSVRLVFFDTSSMLPLNAQAQTRFHRSDALQAQDSIDQWGGERRLVPGKLSLRSWEYKRAAVIASSEPTVHEHGAAAALVGALEEELGQTQYYGSGGEDLARYARRRMEALEAQARSRSGEGSVRAFRPGTHTEITDHYGLQLDALAGKDGKRKETHYLLLAVEHDARNNLPAAVLGPDGAPQEAGYRNRFTALRRDIAWRPVFDPSEHARPTAPSLQTALVVGAPGREIDVDEMGRVLVAFHWDRAQRNTCRLRVACAAAGAGWGMQTLPRVGQEVLIGYLEDDIDRPMVLAAVHNGRQTNPRFSHVGRLPGEDALSGYKSAEFGTGRYNQWIADDTRGQISFKLQSEHAYSEVNLGWLSSARSGGQARARGEGAELRSDGATAVRGGHGVLLSAEAQARGEGAQLERGALDAGLHAAQSLVATAAGLSTHHHADDTDTGALDTLVARSAAWEAGSNTDAEALSAQARAPMVAASGPAGIALVAGESLAAAAGAQIDLSSNGHTQLTAGRSLRLRALEALSLFAHTLGIKLIAAAGKVHIQAQSGEAELGAAADVHIYSSGTRVLTQAPQSIVCEVGASRLTLDGSGVRVETTGSFKVSATHFEFTGPASPAVSLPPMPHSQVATDERFVLRSRGDQALLAQRRYRLSLDDGSVFEGVTDALGRTDLSQDQALRIARVDILPKD